MPELKLNSSVLQGFQVVDLLDLQYPNYIIVGHRTTIISFKGFSGLK